MNSKFKLFIVLGIFTLYSCEMDSLDLFGEDIRDGITGEWKVDEDSELFSKKGLDRFYNVNISKDIADSTAVLVDGFYEFSGKVRLVLNELNILIPDQEIEGSIVEDGSGSISSDFKSITLYYYVDLGIGERDVVRADYFRE